MGKIKIIHENVKTVFAGLGVAGIIIGVVAIVALVVILSIIPLFIYYALFVNMDWNSFWFWELILLTLSRILCIALLLPITIVMPFINGRLTLWLDSIGLVLYSIWGIPLYIDALYSTIFTSLSGLELQRNLLVIILFIAWGVAMFQSISNGIKKEDKTE